MPHPDTEGRYEILRLQLRNKDVTPDIDLLQLARDLPGLVGADLGNIVNEAQLNGETVYMPQVLHITCTLFCAGNPKCVYSLLNLSCAPEVSHMLWVHKIAYLLG